MKTTAVQSPTRRDDPLAHLPPLQQSFPTEVSRCGISHTTFELALAMVPMLSFAVSRTVLMRDLAHTDLPDVAAMHAIGELVMLGALEQRRTRDSARPLPVYRLSECFCARSTLGWSASLSSAQYDSGWAENVGIPEWHGWLSKIIAALEHIAAHSPHNKP
ncbi:hypothetical protein [Burkholderia pseudomallei]|uniref:hypothetical protein n=1 Tax=Burkholderia pseudomallei TaxID=28450 RepID=UPI0040631587